MITVNTFSDKEVIRQQRNMTNSQKRNAGNTKEGIVINNFVKDNEPSLNDIKDTYMISDKVEMPKALYQDTKIVDKKLIPLSAISLGVMSAIAVLTGYINHSAKVARDLDAKKWLPALTRNVNINKENYQVIYQMIQSPNKVTFIAGAGVLTLSAMAFMGKTFFDGYKDIWIKRKEADIQKNLQENLIKVETQSFSGKMQIIRSMLSHYTKEFEAYIQPTDKKAFSEFGSLSRMGIPFSAKNKTSQDKKSTLGNILLGILTFGGIVGLGFVSMKNLSKSKKHLELALENTKSKIVELVKTSKEDTKQTDKISLEAMFTEIQTSKGIKEFIKEQIKKLNWNNIQEKEAFEKEIFEKLETSTTKVNPNIGGDGTPKPAFNSFVDDYKAFFYNYLLDTSNPQFKQLFYGITGLTALSYGGKLAGEAIKDVEVKKINAQTELELQQRLVSTELRNFKAKKDAAISPLVKEFYKQVDSHNRTKEELKNMAENILSEIKNGPPFVYS